VSTVLKLENVSKSFRDDHRGRHTVLSGVSLRVDAGEIVWLRGDSGSGKSTVLNIAGLLSTPDAGSVWVDGRDFPVQLRKSPLGQGPAGLEWSFKAATCCPSSQRWKMFFWRPAGDLRGTSSCRNWTGSDLRQWLIERRRSCPAASNNALHSAVLFSTGLPCSSRMNRLQGLIQRTPNSSSKLCELVLQTAAVFWSRRMTRFLSKSLIVNSQ